jgi:Ca2+-binding RTX toxin-like protein
VTIDTSGAAARFEVVSPQRLELRFTEDVRRTLSVDDLTLQNLTSGQTYDASGFAMEYVNRTHTAVLAFPDMTGGLPFGDYRLTVRGAGVTDAAGNAMAADAVFRFAPIAAPAVNVARGVFIVTGTAGDDTIVVRRQRGNAEMLEVGLNGAFARHALRQISSIRIDALAGDDAVTFDQSNGTLKFRSSIYAGDGNDTVTGGAHRDRVYAGAGDDRVDGGGGHDVIYGGDGNDVLVGARGNDYLVGGMGRDVVEGNLGTDRLIVETGIDRVTLDADDKVVTEQLT